MIRRVFATIALILWSVPLSAEVAPRFEPLFQALALADTVSVMREEGLDYGASIRDELFPDHAGASWQRDVDAIYAWGPMLKQVREEMAVALENSDIDAIQDFFESDLGQEIVGLELSARRAIFDKEIEAASRNRFQDMEAEKEPRVDLITRFVEANDLVEANVAGAMNSNFAFYQGLSAGGAPGYDVSEAEMLADVWEQEIEIRVDTREWVFSYLALAYTPLSDDDLEAYIAFSRTKPGRDLNRALFTAFDRMFVDISRDLGVAAAQYMSGQDI